MSPNQVRTKPVWLRDSQGMLQPPHEALHQAAQTDCKHLLGDASAAAQGMDGALQRRKEPLSPILVPSTSLTTPSQSPVLPFPPQQTSHRGEAMRWTDGQTNRAVLTAIEGALVASRVQGFSAAG